MKKEKILKEKWKTINNFKDVVDGIYQISNYGDVRLKSTKEILHKKIASKKKHPYYAVYLKRKEKNSEWILIHQLVAEFFIPKKGKYAEMNPIDLVPDHLDNNGLNNYVKNLRWLTRGENIKSAFDKGYCDLSGEKHRDSFITNDEATRICELLSEGYNYDEIIDEMNFPETKKYRKLLIRIKHKTSFKHISSKYEFPKHMYTKEQRDTIRRIPLILKLINESKTVSEIFDIVWKDEDVESRTSKESIIRSIKNNKIYSDIIEKYISSTTIERITDEKDISE